VTLSQSLLESIHKCSSELHHNALLSFSASNYIPCLVLPRLAQRVMRFFHSFFRLLSFSLYIYGLFFKLSHLFFMFERKTTNVISLSFKSMPPKSFKSKVDSSNNLNKFHFNRILYTNGCNVFFCHKSNNVGPNIVTNNKAPLTLESNTPLTQVNNV